LQVIPGIQIAEIAICLGIDGTRYRNIIRKYSPQLFSTVAINLTKKKKMKTFMNLFSNSITPKNKPRSDLK
jgi:hypothetical protein